MTERYGKKAKAVGKTIKKAANRPLPKSIGKAVAKATGVTVLKKAGKRAMGLRMKRRNKRGPL